MKKKRRKLKKSYKRMSTPELAREASRLLKKQAKQIAQIELMLTWLVRRVTPMPAKKGTRVVEN